ncbi:MAG: nodulation protein NfeD [Nitrososphaerales archaeon]
MPRRPQRRGYDKRKGLLTILIITLTFQLLPSILAQEDEKKVLLVELNDSISPAFAEHVSAAVDELSSGEYAAMLITLDTFGGLVDSMFSIVDSIQRSPVPVIGYVFPEGKHAFSAGTYILIGTDLAAMAPFTTIGSAQPVGANGPVNDTKVVNALVEKMVTLADLHDRNETQAGRFITHNDNLTPEEALRLGIIEIVARSPAELMEQANGRTVNTLSGEKVIQVEGLSIVKFDRSLRVSILNVISNPLLAGMFISVGFLALILGLTSPGFGAEIAGVILLLLGLIGQGFDVNYGALALMGIGVGLLVFEIYTAGFAVAGIGGIITLGIGTALFITQPPGPVLVAREHLEATVRITLLIVAGFGALFAVVIYKVMGVVRSKKTFPTSPSGEGKAMDEIRRSEIGYIMVGGEYWKARSDTDISKGENVLIVGREDGVLIVTPHNKATRDALSD